MSEHPAIPVVGEIEKLPHWAQVAFAARCARRVQFLFVRNWPTAPADLVKKIDRAIEVSENAAAAAIYATNDIYADNPHPYKAERVSEAAAYAAAVHDTAARAATARAAAYDAYAYAADNNTNDATKHRVGSETARLVAEAIRRDYDLLLTRSCNEHWDDSTPVPPSVFGLLWPEGPPPGWPTEAPPTRKDEPAPEISPPASASPDIRLVLTATVHGDIDVDTITEDLLELYKAINAYHIARGGTGLKLEDFRRMIRSAVGAEV